MDNENAAEERWHRRRLRNKKRRLAAKTAKKVEKTTNATRNFIESNKRNKRKEENRNEKNVIKKTKKKREHDEFIDENMCRLEAARFRFINEQLYTMTGSEAMELFSMDRQAYEAYHKGYNNQAKKWPYNPVNEIIQWLNINFEPITIIADMGCGDAKIARTLKHFSNIHSFDLVALNDKVQISDMSKVPLEKDSVDVVIFCLSLMGTNIEDFLLEANRILKKGGNLKISEISSRFKNIRLFVQAMERLGFECVSKKNRGDGYFIMLDFIKQDNASKITAPGALKLKPCLYKKR